MNEETRKKAHEALDEWLDTELTENSTGNGLNSPSLVNLGYKFAKALSEAKPKA